MVISRRWDNDTRGQGVGSAEELLPHLEQLAGRMAQLDWVAEKPEIHLLPHLKRATERAGSCLRLVSSTVDPDGCLLVDLDWCGDAEAYRDQREAVFALIGSIAETATYVHQQVHGDAMDFEVVLGVPGGDGPFASHGHTLRLRLASAA